LQLIFSSVYPSMIRIKFKRGTKNKACGSETHILLPLPGGLRNSQPISALVERYRFSLPRTRIIRKALMTKPVSRGLP
jgi:hypothetical protein